ncbi:MAG: putative Fe-S cluster assembly protein SufT [Verrucomicrobia bacterium]|nr:putative Fe-S cluster assembly protein SufT [Verrucomicrobiota bacterium]
MTEVPSHELLRDCEAIQIPAGNTVILPAGTPFHIGQSLGGSWTIQALGGLFRVAPKDGDALGLSPHPAPPPVSPASTLGPLEETQVWEALKSCYDPEIPVNIVDLGLIYDLVMEAHPEGGHVVHVKMTLTAPGCGMGGVIAKDAEQKILLLPGVRHAQVDVVWDPPWHQSMITSGGRRILGLES